LKADSEKLISRFIIFSVIKPIVRLIVAMIYLLYTLAVFKRNHVAMANRGAINNIVIN